ncbi:TIGR03643 family protein, partial [Candidatus Marinimicrobia bacterium]|nr:TIGR03643 family protein [Candidatus Neomarinimicrobiota bacterium]
MKDFTQQQLDRIIEMAWEDRTSFEAIKIQFDINQDEVIKIMRSTLKSKSFKIWRQRT